MGKVGRKSKATGRSNPIAKPVKPPSDAELAAIREKTILPVLRDLQSLDTKKRSSAAVAITNIIEDGKYRKLLLREQVVRIVLLETTTDSNLESKSAGWGILRNLVLEEEADFCVHLYRQDVLTAMEGGIRTVIAKVESQEKPLTKLPKAERQLIWSVCTSVVELLSSLAEAHDDIFQAITMRTTFTDFLFGLLRLPTRSLRGVPTALVTSTLSCLAILTEDNKALSQQIIEKDQWFQVLKNFANDPLEFSDHELELLDQNPNALVNGHVGARAITACSVLHNIVVSMEGLDNNKSLGDMSDKTLIPVLLTCMEQLDIDTQNNDGNLTPAQIIQLALETLASMASSLHDIVGNEDPDEKEFEGFADDKEDLSEKMVEDRENGDGAADDDEMDLEEINTDMEEINGANSDSGEKNVWMQDTLELLIRNATPAALRFVRYTTESSENVTVSALSLLNNIAWTVGNIDFATSSTHFQALWGSYAQQIWSKTVSPVLTSNTADISLAESVTSLAWALARSVQGRIHLEADEQNKFMALYHASKSLSESESNGHSNGKSKEPDGFQSLSVKCIGALGRLALSPAPLAINREISIFLLTILATLPSTPAADAIESLNQLFDIYADEEFPCDVVFWADGFYSHLQEVLPKVKKMAKGIDGRKLPELRDRADEVVLNLGRFLKYKRDERRLRMEIGRPQVSSGRRNNDERMHLG